MEAITIFAALLFIFWVGTKILKSYSHWMRLNTVSASKTTLDGLFTLILHGGRHANDLETLAILVKENGIYSFELFAPEFKYEIRKGIQAKDALAQAEAFIGRHGSFHQSKFSGIVDERGNILGYELRPLYLPVAFGTEDVVDVNYKLEADKVVVTIKLKPFIEKMQSS